MRLLIVDDGHYIVEYLKHLLDWSKYGINQVLTTSNPLEAKQILEDTPVDILLTDIRMPEISGVDLLKFVHERRSSCKVIFLSGYSDFEYAQSALRFGAADYLLKPVDKHDMEQAIQQAVDKIRISPQAPREATEAAEAVNGVAFLLGILSDAITVSAGCSSLMQTLSLESFVFARAVSPSLKTEQAFREAAGQLDFLVQFINAPTPLLTALLPSSYGLENIASGETIAYSEPFTPYEKNSARNEFIRLFYQEKIGLADVIFVQQLYEKYTLNQVEHEASKGHLQKLFSLCNNRGRQILFLLELLGQLYTAYPTLTSETVLDWLFLRLNTPQAALDEMLAAIRQLDCDSHLSTQNIVDAIQTYMLNRLESPLNLEEIAHIVHLHPVYLSRFYKQATGENLSSFLAEKRMEKATRLLVDSNLNINDISQMVGYKKSQYFIKLFKQRYGITPYQYRRIKTT